MSSFRTSLGGVANVHCVHDRRKRELDDPDEFRLLFRAAHHRAPHLVARCGCCANLFEPLDDTPRLCVTCTGAAVHELRAPVAEPIEGAL